MSGLLSSSSMEKHGGEALPAVPWEAHRQVPKFILLEREVSIQLGGHHRTEAINPGEVDRAPPQVACCGSSEDSGLVSRKGQARGSKAIGPLSGDLSGDRRGPSPSLRKTG